MQDQPDKTYTAIGLMSGTSLDGLDMAICKFWQKAGNWHYEIIEAETISYTNEWIEAISGAHLLINSELSALHKKYGSYLGSFALEFMAKNKIRVDFIASHGHTVLHEPIKGITFQLGDGNEIAKDTGIPVVWDFRSGDVALGGQGAPLVPAGDKLLFGKYEFCLNLGGFSNISFDLLNMRLAFDICPVNIVLNKLSAQLGFPYDENGKLAASGKIHKPLLEELNLLSFYKLTPPKSLGREWVENNISPLMHKYEIPITNKLRTFCEHIAQQLARSVKNYPKGTILVTGGGSYNNFLMELFRKKTVHQIIIPENKLVQFKEALVFAFLGLLKINNTVNCYASVTGAKRDSIAGIISFP